MKIYHDFIINSQASGIDKKLPQPVDIALDCNNISILEKAILNGYKTSEDSMYLKIKFSLFYGLKQTGITKFGKEYSGTYLRGEDCETKDPFNLLHCLTNVPGATNSYVSKDVLIETTATFSNVENSANSVINGEIQRLVPEQNNDFQKTLPNYF